MHMRLPFYGFIIWFGIAVLHGDLICCGQEVQAQAPQIDYQTQVKPLLRERCFACHGPLRQESNLRLDTLESMLLGG